MGARGSSGEVQIVAGNFVKAEVQGLLLSEKLVGVEEEERVAAACPKVAGARERVGLGEAESSPLLHPGSAGGRRLAWWRAPPPFTDGERVTGRAGACDGLGLAGREIE